MNVSVVDKGKNLARNNNDNTNSNTKKKIFQVNELER